MCRPTREFGKEYLPYYSSLRLHLVRDRRVPRRAEFFTRFFPVWDNLVTHVLSLFSGTLRCAAQVPDLSFFPKSFPLFGYALSFVLMLSSSRTATSPYSSLC